MRFWVVKGIAGIRVADPWAEEARYVGLDRTATQPRVELKRYHVHLADALARGQLEVLAQVECESMAAALAMPHVQRLMAGDSAEALQ